MKTILLFLLSATSLYAVAQETSRGKLTAIVKNNSNAPAENVTVELRKAKDSSLVKVAITDKNGIAAFENIRFGNYLIKTTFVNFATQYAGPFTLSATQLAVEAPAIILQPADLS